MQVFRIGYSGKSVSGPVLMYNILSIIVTLRCSAAISVFLAPNEAFRIK